MRHNVNEMRVRAITLLLGMLALSLTQAESTARDPYRFFFQESFGDFHEELAVARAQHNRPSWCSLNRKTVRSATV